MAARSLATRQPNERLAALIHEAGCSNAGLARRVNMCGAEQGMDLRYDKTSVARWLRGQQPRGSVPNLIAEALGRKLGRPVTVDEIGMADGRSLATNIGLQFAATPAATVDVVTELWRSDVNRRDFLLNSSVAVAALVAPSRDWLITEPDPAVARIGGPRVGASDVEAVRATTDMLSVLDHRFGAGHIRPIVVHYLGSVVSGLLAGSYSDETGRDLFAAVSRLTELAGYMAVDTGQPGLAQRYYIQALRLAQAAGDRPYGGYVLAAGMSHLAGSLGNPREITQLARAAQEGSKSSTGQYATATTMAMFHAAEARGHAQLGDVRACESALARAETEMERSRPDEDPVWIAHFDRAYLADEFAHCYRDLDRPRQAEQAARAALEGHAETRVRRRAVDTLLLATAHLQQNRLDEACAVAEDALDLVGRLHSARGQEYLRDFQRRLSAHGSEPVVRAFLDAVRAADEERGREVVPA
ncbi:transcriptional regulator [Yinghuangia seranimata]|uniref:transcriptional regulator n=1 Tax=Yinghuangia seranimata TaxID=408067 RepID=UPI00248BBD9D|nr:transcriptional regulator [Yinghuangia seranimata]MDI2132833.1 transcriptional regulator [Yinghuangia seranimata]